MGTNHVNSNDFGKGADIFNDIPKMINELVPIIEEGIKKLKEVKFEKANIPNLANAIDEKVKTLKEENLKFFKNRENRQFRSCGGGKGDPENDKKYSAFKKNLIQNTESLFKVNITDFNDRVRRNGDTANWVSIMKFQKLKGRDNEKKPILPDAVKLNIVDEEARKAKILELEELKGSRSAKDAFNKWYSESMNQLIEIFRTLADITEVFYQHKMQVWRETRSRTKTFDVYNNGYPKGIR